MGGFEGGDEGGFWGLDQISRLHEQLENKQSKPNNSFEIHTENSQYHLTILHESLYSTISLIPSSSQDFEIAGYDETLVQASIFYKSYLALLEYTCDSDISDFFCEYKLQLTQDSTSTHSENTSDVLAFLYLLKTANNLILRDDELKRLAESIV